LDTATNATAAIADETPPTPNRTTGQSISGAGVDAGSIGRAPENTASAAETTAAIMATASAGRAA
jgi:hypothetical protein